MKKINANIMPTNFVTCMPIHKSNRLSSCKQIICLVAKYIYRFHVSQGRDSPTEITQDTNTHILRAFGQRFPSQDFQMALHFRSAHHVRCHRIYFPIDLTPKIDHRGIPSSRQDSRRRNCHLNLAIRVLLF